MIEKMTEVEIQKFYLTSLHGTAFGVDRITIIIFEKPV